MSCAKSCSAHGHAHCVPDPNLPRPLTWASDYAIGVPEIDSEHQWLFSLVAKSQAALSSGCCRQIEEIFDELFDYTCRHFANEEALMARIQYPHYLDHCQQHERLRSRLQQLRSEERKCQPAIATMTFLVDWLKCHTTTSDRRIGSFMRKQGLVA